MKTRNFLLGSLLLVFLGLMASCSTETPQEVLNGAFESFVKKDYKALADYIYLDTLEELSSEEKEVFATIMNEQFKDGKEYSSFKIVECKDSTDSIANWKVKSILKDGDSYEEEGQLLKDRNGKWGIFVLNLRCDTIKNDIDTTQTNEPISKDKNYKFMPNVCYAMDKVLSNRGNASAELGLALFLYNGIYCKKDSIEAFRLTKKAAEGGIPMAQLALGQMNLGGYATDANPDEGFKWIKKAADNGYVRAYSALGMCYQNGTSTEKNIEKAMEYFSKGAKVNDTNAMLMLGYNYGKGIGVKEDETKALEWFEKAANLGDVTSQYDVALTYYYQKKYKVAAKWFQKAADQGYSDAQNYLGTMYENGLGVEKDKQKAYDLYKKAAAQGNVYAKNNANRLAPNR